MNCGAFFLGYCDKIIILISSEQFIRKTHRNQNEQALNLQKTSAKASHVETDFVRLEHVFVIRNM